MNIDTQLPYDESRTLRVVFNEAVARSATIKRDALLAIRNIPSAQEISSLHPSVIEILNAGFGFGDYPSEDDRIRAAISYIQRDYAKQTGQTLADALEIALLETNFVLRQGTPPRVRLDGFDDIQLDPADFDDSERNAIRELSMQPPLARRLSFHPDEQKTALIRKAKHQSPQFSIAFSKVFDNASLAITTKLLKDLGEDGGVEQAGYSKSGTDSDTPISPSADDNKRTGRSRKDH